MPNYTVEVIAHFQIEAESQEAVFGKLAGDISTLKFDGTVASRLLSVEVIQTCRFCGCSENNACEISSGIYCAWSQEADDVCTNPDCLAKFEAEKAAA